MTTAELLQQQQAKCTQYINNIEVATFFLHRSRESESMTVYVVRWAYRREEQSSKRVARIQTVLCEDKLRVKRTVVI